MARLFGFIGNRPEVGALLLQAHHPFVAAHPDRASFGWGVGFYHGDEVLLRRRPMAPQPDLSLMLEGVRANELIGHVGPVGGGTVRTENTQPFRYRNWLFAMSGLTEKSLELYRRVFDSLPPFLRSSVRGQTLSELIFHTFLSFLNDAGVLDRVTVEPAHIGAALRCTISMGERLAAEAGDKLPALSMLVANGSHIVGVHGHRRMAYRIFEGRGDIEPLLGPAAARIPALDTCKTCLLIGDCEQDIPQFVSVEHHTLLTIGRDAQPHCDPIDDRKQVRVASAA